MISEDLILKIMYAAALPLDSYDLKTAGCAPAKICRGMAAAVFAACVLLEAVQALKNARARPAL